MKEHLYRKQFRSVSGSALSEMPPALFLLFFFAVFPMLNLIFLGLTYCSCTCLNTLELREACKTPNSQLSAVLTPLQENWQSTGIGQFAGITTAPVCNVSYDKLGDDMYVTVATTFSVKPFLTVPFFSKVPGLGAPLTYTIAAKKILEDPSYASP